MPSAPSANALQRPSGDRTFWRLNSTNAPGVVMMLTPPARASEHSSLRSAWTAMCRVTSDDEHAVSTVTAGPSRPREYEMRPESTAPELPVPR